MIWTNRSKFNPHKKSRYKRKTTCRWSWNLFWPIRSKKCTIILSVNSIAWLQITTGFFSGRKSIYWVQLYLVNSGNSSKDPTLNLNSFSRLTCNIFFQRHWLLFGYSFFCLKQATIHRTMLDSWFQVQMEVAVGTWIRTTVDYGQFLMYITLETKFV